MAIRRRRKRPINEADYDSKGAYIGSNKASAWEKRKYGANYKRGRTRRRRRSRNRFRRNPSSKALVGALVGAGLAAFAWHMYLQSATGQGAPLDKRLVAFAGGGAVAGLLVGGKL